MKHNVKIISFLVILFLLSHIIGLFVIKHYLPEEQNLPLKIEKPQFEEKTSYIPIIVTIIIATALALILLKFKALRLWKLWFFLSVFVCLTIAFSAFMKEKIALVLSLVLSVIKLLRPSIIVHNFTEVFIYGGLASIFVPVLNVFSVIILLLFISVYDMIAVWKTKHMISLAKFQAESNVFAGLFIPYSKKEPIKKLKEKQEHKQAILGGGDVGFTLLFAGVILKFYGFFPALIISVISAISLVLLFVFADDKKFYPAMPFLTLGCLIGLGLVKIIF